MPLSVSSLSPVLQLVWFKRDLRVHDHAPLAAAAAAGRVLPVYVHEPEMRATDDHDGRHTDFIGESLRELRAELSARGAPLLELHGALPELFDALCAELPITAIHAHEETGNAASYARDCRVRAWAKQRGVAMHEVAGSGVVRRLPTRDGWHERWVARIRAPLVAAPDRLHGLTAEERASIPARLLYRANLDSARPTDYTAPLPHRQPGGRDAALALLQSFLHERGHDYRRAMSSPVDAESACSRLSAHLTWGTISTREVYQAARHRARELRDALAARDPHADRAPLVRWQQSLVSFASRLEWRDHFVQKLESEPALEDRPYSPVYDDVWPAVPDAERLAAWRDGRTGYPLVDACMRSLQATGWLTFRMRAMVMSFASHYLWLHWRPAGLVLARGFTDYEPGIHWMQCQMQAGTTGINTIRIYNPVKQAEEHDPHGEFVRRWVPEVAPLPTADLLRPWATPALVQQMHGVHIGRDYPAPIVAHETAYARARDTLHALKREAQQRGDASRVWRQHGSRRTPLGAPNR